MEGGRQRKEGGAQQRSTELVVHGWGGRPQHGGQPQPCSPLSLSLDGRTGGMRRLVAPLPEGVCPAVVNVDARLDRDRGAATPAAAAHHAPRAAARAAPARVAVAPAIAPALQRAAMGSSGSGSSAVRTGSRGCSAWGCVQAQALSPGLSRTLKKTHLGEAGAAAGLALALRGAILWLALQHNGNATACREAEKECRALAGLLGGGRSARRGRTQRQRPSARAPIGRPRLPLPARRAPAAARRPWWPCRRLQPKPLLVSPSWRRPARRPAPQRRRMPRMAARPTWRGGGGAQRPAARRGKCPAAAAPLPGLARCGPRWLCSC